ncbi:hypothetical protein LOZ42_000665 [Ophidiomyces ophidiicola]|nr:hypothetical protein LOZ42_000665 [Ophidiomyces ophidiicola]
MSSHAVNELVPVSYSAGFIVLSYIVSLAGCATCLELLHRRTARFGLYNWYLLLSAAVCMGGIGIWCMHFIGNRATILQGHNTTYQISYSSAFTAVSFFLPIVVLVVAFYFIGASDRAEIWYIISTGALTGVAVCGMHYVGQLGIANFYCSYRPANVVGAAIIAVSASITALGVFFRMRASWTNSWWKRLISATILAIAVSGMHWTATVGTYYHLKNELIDPSGQLSSSQTVIVCTTLSCAACAFLITLAVITNRQHQRLAHRVRQLVLAPAFFDPSGGLMVSPEGLLPTQKITDKYVPRTFSDDKFSKTHPAFIWAYRASRNWPTLQKLIPGMKYHLLADSNTKRFYPGYSGAVDTSVDVDLDFQSIFKELFCVAAQDLATQLHQPLDKLGVLYDDVVITGTQARKLSTTKQDLDPEAQTPQIMGKGKFIFMVRQLSKEESAQLRASGWRFAATPQIAPSLARSMQIAPGEMLRHLESMHEAASPKMMASGVYLVCFSLHPSVRKGFDVLVQKDAPNLLPHVALPFPSVTARQMSILTQMDNWSLNHCLRWLKQQAETHADAELKVFCAQMYKASTRLSDMIDSTTFGSAQFSARRIMIPCRLAGQAPGATGKCTAFSFRIITNLQTRAPSPQMCLTPLRLFTAQQQVYPGVVDHANFQQTILDEFGYCAAYQDGKGGSNHAPSSTTTTGASLVRPGRKSDLSKNGGGGGGGAGSDGDDTPSVRSPAWGGIVVSNQVTVDVTERAGPYESNVAFEMQDMGVTTEARYGGVQETFVDELCAICRETNSSI